ncbi:MAG: metallophosphoesterase [Polyangiaceae bacterium]
MLHRRGWVLLAVLTLGCGSSESAPGGSPGTGGGAGAGGSAGVGGSAGGNTCTPCAGASECSAGLQCAILIGAGYCLQPCPNGNECGAGEACLTESSTTGQALQVCVPQAECVQNPPPTDGGPPNDGGGSAGASGGSGGTGGVDAGTVPPLLFAAVGDTRGSLPLVSSYPTDVITQIYTTIEALEPRPPFVVSTGDYAFQIIGDTSKQLDLYLSARSKYSGEFYPALGNHECTWLTNSNCGPGTADGMTPQYNAFLNKLLKPTGETLPYYTKNVAAPDNSWTAKFVFVAANAWTSAQATWLEAELAKETTYTFILRHEPSNETSAPGVGPSEAIIGKHPYTLSIVGHIHTYQRTAKQVMFGNGGAPKSGTKGWGFGLFSMRPDGAIQVEARDYKTGAVDPSFTFAVYPNGAVAP